MTAVDLKNLLADTIEAPPTTAIDVDVLIRRGRRTQRRRLGAAAASVAVLVATPVAIVAGTHPWRAEPGAAGWSAVTEQQLKQQVTTDVTQLLPGATFTSVNPAIAPFDVVQLSATSAASGADVVDFGGVGHVEVAVGKDTLFAGCDPYATIVRCDYLTGPHAERLVIFIGNPVIDGQIQLRVTAVRTDRSWVSVTAQNWTGAQGKPQPTRFGPPLNIDQLIRIATDPALNLPS